MRPLQRRQPSRPPKCRIIVVMEGTSTEPEYLKMFQRIHGAKCVKLDPIPLGQDPRTIVERAISEKKRMESDADAQDDAFWAMFDRDEHARFPEAVDLAKAHGIRTAISDPCFELWAILHYRLFDAPCGRRECSRELRKLCAGYASTGKLFQDEQAIRNSHADAVQRARKLLKRRCQEGIPGGNPSTTVHELTECIRSGSG